MKHIRVLGEGSFGDVHECEKEDGNRVAIKRFFIKRGNKNIGIINLRELNCVASAVARHPYLVSSTNIWMGSCPFGKVKKPKQTERTDKLYIETPIARYDLLTLIYSGKDVKYSYYKRMMYQILSGLYYLHSHGIVHRDIKPNNILCYFKGGKPIAKITDFGMSRIVKDQDRNSKNIGNNIYKAPECIINNNYGTKIDIWSTAVSFIEMITKKCILNNNEPDVEKFIKISKVIGPPIPDLLQKLTKGYVAYSHLEGIQGSGIGSMFLDVDVDDFNKSKSGGIDSPGTLSDFIDLLSHMLVYDPCERYNAWECLNHAFFKDVKEDETTVIQQPITLVSDALNNPHWKEESLYVFRRIKQHNDTTTELSHRNGALFHAIDIYHRVSRILYKYPNGKTQNYLISKHPDVIVAVCIYIAYKFRFDEDTPTYNDMFYFLQSGKEKVTDNVVEEIERKIIQLLEYAISRSIVYNLIPSDKKYIDVVFEYLLTNKEYYNYTIDEISKVIY
jgi:serine/threonine protein kinase